MKIFTNKQYEALIENHKICVHKITEQYEQEKELRIKAENLKEVLVELANKTGIPHPKLGKYLTWDIAEGVDWGSNSIVLPDDVLQYTDDILGGKVIKQEGTKCLVISKDGKVTEGLTKQKADKGYSYKLIRN